MKNYISSKRGFTLAEITIALLIVGIITVFSIPMIKKQLNKTEEYSYYLAYMTLERVAAEILVYGDDTPEVAMSTETFSGGYKNTYLAKILHYGNKFANIVTPQAEAIVDPCARGKDSDGEIRYDNNCVGNSGPAVDLQVCCCNDACTQKSNACCAGESAGTCQIKAYNDDRVCCDGPEMNAPPTGYAYYTYSVTESGTTKHYCTRQSCIIGTFASNRHICCPEHSSAISGDCQCNEGYGENNKNTGCVATACPFRSHYQNGECVVNPAINNPKTLCNAIIKKWNVKKRNNNMSCETFSGGNYVISGNPSDKLFNKLFATAQSSDSIFMSVLVGNNFSMNGITPNVIFSNGQKLWIVSGRHVSIPGLSYNTRFVSTTVQNLCEEISLNASPLPAQQCTDNNGYYCAKENRCYKTDNTSKTYMKDARSCCVNVSKSDILDRSADAANAFEPDASASDKNRYKSQIYDTDPRVIAESGYLVLMDINGDKGQGKLWEDVYPFYLTDSGKVVPGYPLSAHKKVIGGSSSDQDSAAVYIAGNNPAYISADIYYFENEKNNRKKVLLYNSISYARAACISHSIGKYTPYCLNLGSNYAKRKDASGNVINDNPCDTKKCYVRIRKKTKFL